MSERRPSKLAALVMGARPRTLPAAAAPVVVGAAVACHAGGFRAVTALAALFGGLMIQVGVNYANDVQDFESGADDERRVGPTRVAAAGLLAPREVKLAAIVSFALAALAGVHLIAVGGWPILAIGVASIVCGYAYTGGPFPLAHHGLADLFVMIFFGFAAVCGTVWAQMRALPPLALWSSLAVGSLVTMILVVNNVRDVESDRRAGRRTLPVVLGRTAGVVEYGALALAAFLVPPLLVLADAAPAWTLLTLGSLPSAARLTRRLATEQGPPLNGVLAATGRLLLLYAVLFSAGLVLGRPAAR